MKKSTRIISYIAIFVFVFTLGWQVGGYFASSKSQQGQGNTVQGGQSVPGLNSIFGNSTKSHEDINLEVFWQVWDRLINNYVDEQALKKPEMVYGAIKGLANSLQDPYTVYMTPEETREFDHNLNSELEGIGAELAIKDELITVVSPLKNSPAQKAGLLPGDIIYKIDGEITSEMSLIEATKKIRGEKGTEVILTILRKNQTKPLEIKIVRDTIELESVSMEEKGNGIYYVSINQFSDNTKEEFEKAIGQIAIKKPKGLILDLRFNGGGYLETAVDVLSVLIKGRENVVTVKQRDPRLNQTFYTSGNPKLPDTPIVILINRGSASASEIVAGAIQDIKRGFIIGEKSFGKGSVQEVEKLKDNSSLRMTIAKWYTPLDRSIDKVGIEPDMKVEIIEKDIEAQKDTQLEAAIDYLKKL